CGSRRVLDPVDGHSKSKCPGCFAASGPAAAAPRLGDQGPARRGAVQLMPEKVHPTPSGRARELVAGAYDLHVHVAPDVIDRRIDDFALAGRFRDEGMAGFVLKSHYTPTSERAAVVRRSVPGADVLGAVTLNGSVRGMNATAGGIAPRSGAPPVWFPPPAAPHHPPSPPAQ